MDNNKILKKNLKKKRKRKKSVLKLLDHLVKPPVLGYRWIRRWTWMCAVPGAGRETPGDRVWVTDFNTIREKLSPAFWKVGILGLEVGYHGENQGLSVLCARIHSIYR
jgi:hypothetical protein